MHIFMQIRVFDGTNCTYDSAFVGENNPLEVDLTIPFITGAHIFFKYDPDMERGYDQPL